MAYNEVWSINMSFLRTPFLSEILSRSTKILPISTEEVLKPNYENLQDILSYPQAYRTCFCKVNTKIYILSLICISHLSSRFTNFLPRHS